MNRNIREQLLLTYENNKKSSFGLIAKELINCYDNGIFLNSKELADLCFVSKSMISYFCKKNNWANYNELITYLKMDLENASVYKRQQNNEENFLDNLQFLDNSFESQIENIKELVNKIQKYKTIIIYSSYTNTAISTYFCDFLIKNGKNAIISNHFYSLDMLVKNNKEDEYLLLYIVSGPNNKLLVESWNEMKLKIPNNMFLISTEAAFNKFEVFELNYIILKTFSSNIKQDKLFYLYRSWSLNTLFLKIAYFLLN